MYSGPTTLALDVGYCILESLILMILPLLVTTFIGHRLWRFDGAAARLHIVQIRKNVAIIGGSSHCSTPIVDVTLSR